MSLGGKLGWSLLLLQLIFVGVFAIFVQYGPDLDPRRASDVAPDALQRKYPYFQDVNVMIFVGIGYLYAFLARYGYSGVTLNFLLCAVCVQWGIITHHAWHGTMEIGVDSLFKGEFAAAGGAIALGALFGKVSCLQMIAFVLLEVLAYSTVNHCCHRYLQVCDVGESVALHLFAAVFGCSTAYVLDKRLNPLENKNERHSYQSNLLCMLGTLILWVFWPSFNAEGDEGDSQHRSVTNTFLALLGSGISSIAASALLHPHNKLTMAHVQNGALAGAVGVGSTSNLMIRPFGALLVGTSSGILCVAGFKYLTPFLSSRLHLHDPCGINSLHGLPGLFAGIVAVLAAFIADTDTYGPSLYKFYPAMAPAANASALLELLVERGTGRTMAVQALYQLIYVVVVAVASCLSGLLTGAVLRIQVLDPIEEKQMYLDEVLFDMSDIDPENPQQPSSPCTQPKE